MARRTSPQPRASRQQKDIIVRMYNVGFGDAFLVLLPDGNGSRKILFDCGSIEAAPEQTMADVVERIIQDATGADGIPRIDVVVCTHRHKDHVSGFGNPAWETVAVGEVWMPWTEDPTDDDARQIRNVQSRLAMTLDKRLAARAANLDAAGQADLQRYREMVSNALMLSNDKAMTTLHSGFSGNPARLFLPSRAPNERSFTTEALPGVRVHIMGPSRERSVIRDMDPPSGESYLRLGATMSKGEDGKPPTPFASEHRSPQDIPPFALSAEDIGKIDGASNFDELAIAVALDKAVNGTSLMIMLEIAGKFLLFPGDAQWGTWQAAIADPQWREMLGRTVFYKIGHHGSHNATPKDFVEQMLPDEAWAMASTKVRSIWPDIPRKPLIDALTAKHARIARSDKDSDATDFAVEHGKVVEMRIPVSA